MAATFLMLPLKHFKEYRRDEWLHLEHTRKRAPQRTKTQHTHTRPRTHTHSLPHTHTHTHTHQTRPIHPKKIYIHAIASAMVALYPYVTREGELNPTVWHLVVF